MSTITTSSQDVSSFTKERKDFFKPLIEKHNDDLPMTVVTREQQASELIDLLTSEIKDCKEMGVCIVTRNVPANPFLFANDRARLSFDRMPMYLRIRNDASREALKVTHSMRS